MFVSGMAFHAKISDPVIGGTYMTLLNTVSNLGGVWPSSLVLWAVDGLTWKTCSGAVGNLVCNTAAESKVHINSFEIFFDFLIYNSLLFIIIVNTMAVICFIVVVVVYIIIIS